MTPRKKTTKPSLSRGRTLILPVGCYIIGTLVGSLYCDIAPPATGLMLLLLTLLFCSSLSLFGVLLTGLGCFGFGLLTGGIFASLFHPFTWLSLLSLLPMAFLLAPCLLLLASFSLQSSLFFIQAVAASRREAALRQLVVRLVLCTAAALSVILLCMLLSRIGA